MNEKSQNTNRVIKILYILLLIFVVYLFYHKITLMVMDFFNSNPTIYKDFLYFYSNIKNNTLEGLLYISSLGALFFLTIPMEAIFIYYLNSTSHHIFFIISIITLGSIIGLSINYFIGKLLGGKLLKRFFEKENYDKYETSVNKYGALVLILGNILPSPIEPVTLLYGAFNYDYKKFLLFCFIGRIIKYTILFIAFYFFWDQIIFFYDDLIEKINPLNYISF